MQTCINTMNDESRYMFSSDERKWITRIHKLAVSHPDEVTIKREPETNDGCIVATFPTRWLKIVPPRKVSEEQREIARERFLTLRARR